LAVRPWWAARIREYLGDKEFLQVRNLAGEDLSKYSRLWVVSLSGHEGKLRGPFSDGSYPRTRKENHGALSVELYDLPKPVEVLFDFRRELDKATVTMRTPGGPKHCSRWVENRWVCSRRDWNYVGRMIVELGEDPREIIWAHPAEYPIEIIFPAVPGGKNMLVHTGFTPPAARTPGGAAVTLTVMIDGKELGKVVQENKSGYFPTLWDMSPLGPGPHQVTFIVKAPHGGMRHFCFNGQVRK